MENSSKLMKSYMINLKEKLGLKLQENLMMLLDFSSQLVMVSLMFILIKLFFVTTLSLSLFLIPFLLVFSLSYNLREVMKPYMSKMLGFLLSQSSCKSLGGYTVSDGELSSTWILMSSYNLGDTSFAGIVANSYTYALKCFFNAICFYVYCFLSFIRVLMDSNIYKYLMFYWMFSVVVVFNDHMIWLSVIGLVMVFSSLGFYVISENYNEFLAKVEYNNPKFSDSTLVLNYQNLMLVGLLGACHFDMLHGMLMSSEDGDSSFEYSYYLMAILSSQFIKDHVDYYSYFVFEEVYSVVEHLSALPFCYEESELITLERF